MQTTQRKRMKREKGGWLNLNDTFITNKQRAKFDEINKRIDRHNRQGEKIVETLNKSSFGNGNYYEKMEFYNYKLAKSKETVNSLSKAMNKFNRSLDKYGSYKQKHHLDNFKKSVINEFGGGNSKDPNIRRVLQKINQLEPQEFNALSMVNDTFVIKYNYYDDNAGLKNLETELDNYLNSDTRKQIQGLIRKAKI